MPFADAWSPSGARSAPRCDAPPSDIEGGVLRAANGVAEIGLLGSKLLLPVFACGLRLRIEGSRFLDSNARRHGVSWVDAGALPLAANHRPRFRRALG